MYYVTPFLSKGIVGIFDHLNGFDQNYYSEELEKTVNFAKENGCNIIHTGYILPSEVKSQYPDINFSYNEEMIGRNIGGWDTILKYKKNNSINYKNFLCSFNGIAPHVGRVLLISTLKKFDYFNNNYCTKNFSFDSKTVDNYIIDLIPDKERFYRKFFQIDNNENFFNEIISYNFTRHEHLQNIQNLETKLTESFLHIVSETLPTSYVPFITEKFLYSIVTKGLFLAYGQPNWHQYLNKFFGFKKYDKIFNYSFDSIQNPVIRVVELMSMISKFKNLTPHEWHDLYLIEEDTIQYNYDHYCSRDYLKNLAKFS